MWPICRALCGRRLHYKFNFTWIAKRVSLSTIRDRPPRKTALCSFKIICDYQWLPSRLPGSSWYSLSTWLPERERASLSRHLSSSPCWVVPPKMCRKFPLATILACLLPQEMNICKIIQCKWGVSLYPVQCVGRWYWSVQQQCGTRVPHTGQTVTARGGIPVYVIASYISLSPWAIDDDVRCCWGFPTGRKPLRRSASGGLDNMVYPPSHMLLINQVEWQLADQCQLRQPAR